MFVVKKKVIFHCEYHYNWTEDLPLEMTLNPSRIWVESGQYWFKSYGAMNYELGLASCNNLMKQCICIVHRNTEKGYGQQ